MMQLNRRVWQVTGLVSVLMALALLVSLQAEAQSGGAIMINIRAGGADATGKVVILTAEAEPQKVAHGKAGRPISVPPGTYDVEITCTELLDHPTQQLRGLEVAGSTVEREATFPAGTLTLRVRRGGKMLKNKTLHFKTKAGDELPGTAKTGRPFKMTPGNYTAEIIMGRGRNKIAHSITGIQIYDGAKRSLTADL